MSCHGPISFKFMTYNILADGLSGAHNEILDHKTFLNVPRDVLMWQTRGPSIIREIVGTKNSPHIVCLQEVDQFEYLERELSEHGYEGIFKAKEWSPNEKIAFKKLESGSEMEKNYWQTSKPDGTAIFWKRDSFEHIETLSFAQTKEKCNIRHALIEQKHMTNNTRIRIEKRLNEVPQLLINGFVNLNILQNLFGSKDVWTAEKSCRLARINLGLQQGQHCVDVRKFVNWLCEFSTPQAVGAKLRLKTDPTKHLVVISFHLYSDKSEDGEYVRLEELKGLTQHPSLRLSLQQPQTSLFMGCDMNSSSRTEKRYSPLGYRYITGSPVQEDDIKEVLEFCDLKLRSAYRDFEFNGLREPEFSTWKYRMKKNEIAEDKHTIDFIFYQSELWKPIYCLHFPNVEFQDICSRLPPNQSPLPNAKFPSDHFPLMTEFQLTEEKSLN